MHRNLLHLQLMLSSIACVLLAACVSGPVTVPAAVSRPAAVSWPAARAGAKKPAVFILNSTGSTAQLLGYPTNNKKNSPPSCMRSLAHASFGITSDAMGKVYVASDDSRGGIVEVHASGCGKTISTINDGFNKPFDVAVHGSTIYAAGPELHTSPNVAVCTLSGCGSKLTDSAMSELWSIAVDSAGNVWAAYYTNYGYVGLTVWPNGEMPGQHVSGYSTYNPGDIMFDKNDTLVVVEYDEPEIYRYSCDANKAQCAEIGKTAISHTPQYGALNEANTDIQITEYDTGNIEVYRYPSFKFEYSYNNAGNGELGPLGITQIGGE